MNYCLKEIFMPHFYRVLAAALLIFFVGIAALAIDEDAAAAAISNDEGGVVVIHGEVEYTNPLFTAGVSEPLVILEDQTGFVTRNRYYLFPPESQVLGQITSDFRSSPFSYSLTLPIVPQAPLNDVDHDGIEETGVMVFQIAYWTNTFGDAFLEQRDLGGGGWSGAYASADVSSDADNLGEYLGGNILIFAPEVGQGFPSGFGEDGMLFTEDDPIVIVPQGYTLVNMDSEVFTFDRSREAEVDLIEGEGAEATDFSDMSYTEAFDALIEKFRIEYPFTEHKGLDWDAITEEYRPMFEEAEDADDPELFARALQAFAWAIPDGHIGVSLTDELVQEFLAQTNGDLGIAIRQLDDGRVIVNFLRPDSPADEAGIEIGAEIIAFNDVPIEEAMDATVVWSRPFSMDHVLRLQQLRYVTRYEVGVDVDVTYRNPDGDEETVTLTTVENRDAFAFSSFNVAVTGTELPVEWEPVGESTMLVSINSFFDDERLTILLWERMIRDVQALGLTGIIIDMRHNGGGSGFLADQMAAYFFQEPLELGYTAIYDETVGDFYYEEEFPAHYFLPAEELRFDGPVAILVGPSCASACEFFGYNITLEDRATVVGQYPTAGLGGGIEDVILPDDFFIRMPIARPLDMEGNIIIENVGIVPDVVVPVNEDTLGLTDVSYFRDDPVLEAGIEFIEGVEATAEGEEEEIPSIIDTDELEIVDGGDVGYDEEIEGSIEAGQRVQYTFTIEANADPVSIYVLGDLDTYLRIYDASGEELLIENDNYAGTENSGYPSIALDQDVTVVLEVGTAGDSGSGDYTLLVTTGDTPFEIAVEEAGSIEIGDSVEGEFVSGVRFSYSLELDADTPITISLNAPDDMDTYLRVYDEDGELLAENDDISNNNHNSAIEDFSLDEAGTITIVVGTYTDSDEGSYELLVEEGD
jgi:C-terminal processing protease CtpA/Prc